MLTETFLFLPGVNTKTEQRIWACGIRNWDDLLDADHIPSISRERLSFWKTRIRHAKTLLEQENGLWHFARMVGSRYAWRVYQDVLDNPRYVDIETTEYHYDITVIGVSDGEFYQAFVRDKNLTHQALRRAFAGATCIVTFNGGSFDLPIIERNFPGVLPSVPHLDLRHICAQAGLRGGLKRIERQLGIRRAAAIRDTNGVDAIMLWYRHKLGDEQALIDLVDYNAADVLNLAPLAKRVIKALWCHHRYGEALPFPTLVDDVGVADEDPYL